MYLGDGGSKTLVDDFTRWMKVCHAYADSKLGRKMHHCEQSWVTRLDRLARLVVDQQRCPVDITKLGSNLLQVFGRDKVDLKLCLDWIR